MMSDEELSLIIEVNEDREKKAKKILSKLSVESPAIEEILSKHFMTQNSLLEMKEINPDLKKQYSYTIIEKVPQAISISPIMTREFLHSIKYISTTQIINTNLYPKIRQFIEKLKDKLEQESSLEDIITSLSYIKAFQNYVDFTETDMLIIVAESRLFYLVLELKNEQRYQTLIELFPEIQKVQQHLDFNWLERIVENEKELLKEQRLNYNALAKLKEKNLNSIHEITSKNALHRLESTGFRKKAKNLERQIYFGEIKRHINAQVAVKEYKTKHPEIRDNILSNEVHIISRISNEKLDCFLKYYGSYVEETPSSFVIGIITEKCLRNLKEEIELRRKYRYYYKEEELLDHFKRLVQGFVYITDMNIFHHDIKPSNILVTQYGSLRIADFGHAILSNKQEPYLIRGTSGYLAPELQKEYDAGNYEPVSFPGDQTDVFSLGLTFLSMISLRNTCKLNTEERKAELHNLIDEIRFSHLKAMVGNMLDFEYSNRWNFYQLQEFINQNIS